MKKTLAAYFSASGTTRKVAEMIAEAGDCALYEITPKELYTNDDLNWMNKKSRSSVEMSDKKIRSQIQMLILKNMILLSWDFRSGGMWHLPL